MHVSVYGVEVCKYNMELKRGCHILLLHATHIIIDEKIKNKTNDLR